MNSIVEARVGDYLRNALHVNFFDCGTVLECLRSLARMAGHELDERFAHAGLGAGPEARIASRIVDRALGGGGWETSDYAIRAQIRDWLRRHPRRGR